MATQAEAAKAAKAAKGAWGLGGGGTVGARFGAGARHAQHAILQRPPAVVGRAREELRDVDHDAPERIVVHHTILVQQRHVQRRVGARDREAEGARRAGRPAGRPVVTHLARARRDALEGDQRVWVDAAHLEPRVGQALRLEHFDAQLADGVALLQLRGDRGFLRGGWADRIRRGPGAVLLRQLCWCGRPSVRDGKPPVGRRRSRDGLVGGLRTMDHGVLDL